MQSDAQSHKQGGGETKNNNKNTKSDTQEHKGRDRDMQ